MAQLGFVQQHPTTGEWVPLMKPAVLAAVWELRWNVAESITVGQLLPQLVASIAQKTKQLNDSRGHAVSESHRDEITKNKEKGEYHTSCYTRAICLFNCLNRV